MQLIIAEIQKVKISISNFNECFGIGLPNTFRLGACDCNNLNPVIF